jgi:branched-chain amino acid transport system permease protein
MVTLAFGEMMYSLFHDTRFAGGSDGAYINVKPQVALGAMTLLDFEHRVSFYYACLALLVACYLLLLAIARGPFGRVLQGIRWNETRIAALGFNTYAHKLVSFTLAGAIAGLAGALFATIDGYVTPDLFGWRQSGFAVMMIVLGGVGTLAGPIFGAVLYAGLEEVLKTASLVGPIAAHWSLALGIILIAAVLLAPRGVAGLLQPERDDSAPLPPAQPTTADVPAPAKSPSIAVAGLTRRFGGLVAVDDVTLALDPNRVHAIIGPNGAGKTTFINMLSGALPPSRGEITLDGTDVAGRPAYAMARLGIGRSYQITNVVLPFTVAENCRLAAQARRPLPFRLRSGAHAAEEASLVQAALTSVGLTERAATRAAHLSHGEQRQLEIAMVIATDPRIVLLDEPLAGMSGGESRSMVELIRSLRVARAVLLVEHDMDAVFAVADRLTVMADGSVIASGAPEQVRRHPAVRAAYLGAEAPLP